MATAAGGRAGDPAGPDDVVELTVDGDAFTLAGGEDGLLVRSGGAGAVRASVALDLDAFVRLLDLGSRPADACLAGDPTAARHDLDTLAALG